MNTLAPEKIVNSSSHKEQAHKEPPPRERILAAAHELFYKHGIHVVSVDQIAEAASSNKMTLYRHFKSKDELVKNVKCQAFTNAIRIRRTRFRSPNPMCSRPVR